MMGKVLCNMEGSQRVICLTFNIVTNYITLME